MTDPKADAAISSAVEKASGLPHAYAAAPPLAEPLPAALQRHPTPQKSPAEWAYDRLILYIRNFEKHLDADQEIAMGFAGSDAGVLKIEGLGFFEPDLITFFGCDENGMKNQLIQHVQQLSVMLRAVPKAQPEAPPNRIVFRLASGSGTAQWGDPLV